MLQCWHNRQRIYRPAEEHGWIRSHAQIPTPDWTPQGTLRIYLGARDAQKYAATQEFRFVACIDIEDWNDTVEELAPVSATLGAKGQTAGRVVPVHLHAKVTELGLLELSCRSRDGAESWKLQFNVREK